MVELAWPIIKLTCRDRKNVDDQHWGTLSSGAGGGGDGMGGEPAPAVGDEETRGLHGGRWPK